MTTEPRPPVLVTGGAGYMESHAVLALHDAGWPTAVIGDLSIGFAYTAPDSAPLYSGDVVDAQLLARIFHGREIGATAHFAGSMIVPESVEKPLDDYQNNTLKSLPLAQAAARREGDRAESASASSPIRATLPKTPRYANSEEVIRQAPQREERLSHLLE